MASLFKPTKHGKKSRLWYASYIDENNKRKTKALYADKTESRQEANRLEKEAKQIRDGFIPRTYANGRGAIGEHVAEFMKTRRKCSAAYQRELERQLLKVCDDCGFDQLTDISADKVTEYIAKLEADGKGPKTRNEYRAAINTLCNWSVKTQRLTFNPIAAVTRESTREDTRRNRRALTYREALRLVTAAQRRPMRRGKNGAKYESNAEREQVGIAHALIWKTLLLTGIRRGELRALTWADVDLEAGHIYISAAVAKSGYERYVTLHPSLIEDLKAWRDSLSKSFTQATDPFLPIPANLVRVLAKDLEAAGIDRRQGGSVDVHSLRVTCGSWLAARGHGEYIIAKHLGHRFASVTSRHYVKLAASETREAVAMLPEIRIRGLNAPRNAPRRRVENQANVSSEITSTYKRPQVA